MDRFTKFDGRMGRSDWWVGVLILVIIALIVGFVIGLIFGSGFLGRLIQLLFTLVLFYGYAAMSTRRLQDRGKPQMPWLAIFIGPSLLLNVMQLFGIGFRERVVEFAGTQATAVVPGPLGYLFFAAAFASGVWALVELGILRGTVGDNEYGPDPVA